MLARIVPLLEKERMTEWGLGQMLRTWDDELRTEQGRAQVEHVDGLGRDGGRLWRDVAVAWFEFLDWEDHDCVLLVRL